MAHAETGRGQVESTAVETTAISTTMATRRSILPGLCSTAESRHERRIAPAGAAMRNRDRFCPGAGAAWCGREIWLLQLRIESPERTERWSSGASRAERFPRP